MSQRLRFSDIQNSRIPAKVGVCADADELMAWCNGFQERALNYGRWWGSVQLAQFCITGGTCGSCIVLPREIAVIEAANLNGIPVQVQNQWGQFIRPHASLCGSTPNASTPCNGFVRTRCGCGCGCATVPQMEDEGMVPSFSVTSAGDTIRFYPASSADVGKKVVVQGNDSNGIWVRSTIDGVVQDGEQVTLALPFAETTTAWAAGAPYAIYKEPTSYRVLMFAVDADDNERQLADYQPDETNPTYRKVKIPGLRSTCGCSGNQSLRCLVSLQHIPITSDNDWLLFTNLSAYSDGILAEKYYENGDVAQGDAYFFGLPKPPRNARGILRVAVGNGAIPQLTAELRKMSGDRTSVAMQRDGLSLVGFV